MKKPSLEDLREKLHKKDREIVKLLNERAQLSMEVGRAKNSLGNGIYDPAQESKVYEYLKEINEFYKKLADELRESIDSVLSS